MPKYTKELKVQLVLEYLSGEIDGHEKVAERYDIPNGTLKSWIEEYKSGGFDNLSKKLKNNKFTSEFKLSVMQYRQIRNISLRETAEYFNLMNEFMIYGWRKTYQERGPSGLEDNRGRLSKGMIKSNKKSRLNTPISEGEREELIRLRGGNRLLGVRIVYEKELQALLLEEEAEVGRRQR